MRRRFLIILAATLGALPAPSGAHAATLSFSGDVLTYTAASGEENNLTTSIPATGFCTVRTDPCLSVSESSGVVITSFPSGDCSATDSASVVECRVPAAMVVVLDDRDDTLFDWSGPSTVDGGTGNDGLDGNAGSDQVSGGAGNDALRGESGDDTLDGGDGDDSLEGFGLNSGDTENDTTGRDVYVGGAGADLVDYTARTDPLTLDLDGAADDGGSGEGDRIAADVERLYAGSGNDVLTGNAAVNWLYGYGGEDLLTAVGPTTSSRAATTPIGCSVRTGATTSTAVPATTCSTAVPGSTYSTVTVASAAQTRSSPATACRRRSTAAPAPTARRSTSTTRPSSRGRGRPAARASTGQPPTPRPAVVVAAATVLRGIAPLRASPGWSRCPGGG